MKQLLIFESMRIWVIVCLMVLIAWGSQLHAQSKNSMSQPVIYIHNEPLSRAARATNTSLQLLGLKKKMEKRIFKAKFNTRFTAPPANVKRRFQVAESQFENRTVYTISPKPGSGNVVIVYLHGGAYVNNLLRLHWNLISLLVEKTGATIIIPDYPLAPQAHCSDVYAFLWRYLSELESQYRGKRFIFMGDSAGGGLALGLAQYMRNEHKPMASQIIMLSPWLDLSMQNPEIDSVECFDKMLGKEALLQAAKIYAGTLPLNDYRVSPIYGNFDGLGEVSLFIGTHDILMPDCRKICREFSEKGIAIRYYEYPSMFHVWMAVSSLPEGRHATDEIIRLIREE